MSIEVVTSYTWDGSLFFDSIAEKAAGRVADFAGAGMGKRDLGWVAKSQLDAERMKRALDKVGMIAKIRVCPT